MMYNILCPLWCVIQRWMNREHTGLLQWRTESAAPEKGWPSWDGTGSISQTRPQPGWGRWPIVLSQIMQLFSCVGAGEGVSFSLSSLQYNTFRALASWSAITLRGGRGACWPWPGMTRRFSSVHQGFASPRVSLTYDMLVLISGWRRGCKHSFSLLYD